MTIKTISKPCALLLSLFLSSCWALGLPPEHDPFARWQAKSIARDFIHALATKKTEEALKLCAEDFWLKEKWLKQDELRTQLKAQNLFQTWQLKSLSYYSPQALSQFGYPSALSQSQRADAYVLAGFQLKNPSVESPAPTYTSFLLLRYKQGQWLILGADR